MSPQHRRNIKIVQAHIARLNENLDYDTKVLYRQVRFATRHLNEDELAKALQKGLSD